jgi:hypothetical protein
LLGYLTVTVVLRIESQLNNSTILAFLVVLSLTVS